MEANDGDASYVYVLGCTYLEEGMGVEGQTMLTNGVANRELRDVLVISKL